MLGSHFWQASRYMPWPSWLGQKSGLYVTHAHSVLFILDFSWHKGKQPSKTSLHHNMQSLHLPVLANNCIFFGGEMTENLNMLLVFSSCCERFFWTIKSKARAIFLTENSWPAQTLEWQLAHELTVLMSFILMSAVWQVLMMRYYIQYIQRLLLGMKLRLRTTQLTWHTEKSSLTQCSWLPSSTQ